VSSLRKPLRGIVVAGMLTDGAVLLAVPPPAELPLVLLPPAVLLLALLLAPVLAALLTAPVLPGVMLIFLLTIHVPF
jgi:hypothetical protein